MEFLKIKELILDTEGDVTDNDRFRVLRLLDAMRDDFSEDSNIDVLIDEYSPVNVKIFKKLFKSMRTFGFDVNVDMDGGEIIAKRNGEVYASFLKTTDVYIFMSDKTKLESLIDKFKHYGK